MEGMHLGNIKQSNNLMSGRFKPCVGMMFASVLTTVSPCLNAQESPLPRPDEVPVFGSEGRSATLNSFSSNVLEHMQKSVNQEPIKGLEQMTHAVSLVASGGLVIENFPPNGRYEKYNDFSDLISMKIMAETLIIRSMIVKSGSLVS